MEHSLISEAISCVRLAISLGGDADTLAAFSGPMAYAYYKKMPDALISQALKKLPNWMVDVSERFDIIINSQVKLLEDQINKSYFKTIWQN
jgi:ADP-ribosylglycohydrolase